MKTLRFENGHAPLARFVLAGVVAGSMFALTQPAAAQSDTSEPPPVPPSAAPAPAPAPGDATAGAGTGANTEAPSSAPAEAPAAAAPAEPAPPAAGETKSGEGAEAKASASATLGGAKLGANASGEAGGEAAPADSEEASEGVAKPPPIAIELLPASAYPNTPIPGIKNGSLASTIEHLQWPYMPRYAGPPALRVGISGSAWVDSNYRKIKAGLVTEDDQTEIRQQGRFTFRVTPTYNADDGFFVQSNVEFIGNSDQDHNPTNYTDVDDAWIRVGKWKLFDVQVGRMQGFEVYHYGMGMDQNTFERQGAVSASKTPVQPYGASDLWDRGLSTGSVALHWYLPEFLRLEVLGRFGLSGQGSDIGIRPAAVFDLGWMKLKGAYERRLRPSIFDKSDARVETQGFGGQLQFVIDPWVEFGGGAARRWEDAFEQDGAVRPGASHDTLTYGGFLNVRPYFEDFMVGVGYHYTDWQDFNFDAFGEREKQDHRQMFAAIQYTLWNKLYIKYVLASSKGHIEERNDSDPNDDGFDNKSLSHRLRLAMTF